MATIRWAEVCDHVVVEQIGKVGVLGMFDQINAPNFPFDYPDFWVICKIEGMPQERVRVEISLVGPDGEILASLPPIEGVTSPTGGTVVAGRIFRPRFPKAGRYEIRFRLSGNPATSVFLNVVPVPQQSQRGSQPGQR